MGLLDGEIAEIVADAMGEDVFLPATLTRDVPAAQTSPAYEEFDPPEPTAVTYTCRAIESEYSAGLRANGLVGARDVEVLIIAKTIKDSSGALVDLEPEPGDRLSVNSGASRTIVPASSSGKKAVEGDPARATWACRCMS